MYLQGNDTQALPWVASQEPLGCEDVEDAAPAHTHRTDKRTKQRAEQEEEGDDDDDDDDAGIGLVKSSGMVRVPSISQVPVPAPLPGAPPSVRKRRRMRSHSNDKERGAREVTVADIASPDGGQAGLGAVTPAPPHQGRPPAAGTGKRRDRRVKVGSRFYAVPTLSVPKLRKSARCL